MSLARVNGDSSLFDIEMMHHAFCRKYQCTDHLVVCVYSFGLKDFELTQLRLRPCDEELRRTGSVVDQDLLLRKLLGRLYDGKISRIATCRPGASTSNE